ncbi:MAG: hypothetical protein ACREV1_16310 [Gammaproteobacteria bacterium]
MLDYILTGERFDDYASHLSLVDRGPARALAKNQRDQLQQRLRQCLEVAYGIANEPRDAVENRLDGADQLRSLDPTFRPLPPVGANLKGAFDNLLNQLFSHQYPAHPKFDAEVRTAVLKKVRPEIERAIEAADGRVLVQDRAIRQLIRSVANPLRLGEMGETHFVLGHHWKTHFLQSHAREGGSISVAKLRAWIDAPQPMGLLPEVQNLIILTFAGQTNRSFVLNGGPYSPALESLPNDLELREQALPSKEDWDRAIARAAGLFGLTVPQTLNAANVAKLVDAILGKVKEERPAVESLAAHLPQRTVAYVTERIDTPRIQTVRSAQALLSALAHADRQRARPCPNGNLRGRHGADPRQGRGARRGGAYRLLATVRGGGVAFRSP